MIRGLSRGVFGRVNSLVSSVLRLVLRRVVLGRLLGLRRRRGNNEEMCERG